MNMILLFFFKLTKFGSFIHLKVFLIELIYIIFFSSFKSNLKDLFLIEKVEFHLYLELEILVKIKSSTGKIWVLLQK